MKTVTAFVLRDPTACWRAFTEATTLVGWVPGLRRAQVIALGPHRLPSEIHFEFASSLVYTLVYSYDVDGRTIKWEPKLGRRDGVTGSVSFVARDGGTEINYALEQGDGRDPAERVLGEPQALIDAFVAWMQHRG